MECLRAILMTAGPVSTFKAVQYTRMSLHNVTSEQFVNAAMELQEANLGMMVKLQGKGSPAKVFIKKPPDEVDEALSPYVDLCTVDVYRKRYHLPTSKSISFSLRAKLVAAKLVADKLFV